ncbi:MAG: prepilin-type N-terminal cleavage/methylation domain-containing protein [Terriglobia bacterium]|nr:prepilin-type N-terminal cleavage/methylation domain-containing protein [Terriglobia bacterium]
MQKFEVEGRRGFTLLELVVVVAIMLAIAAYAIPNVLRAMADYKLKNTMMQVAAICQQQRMQAVRTNSTLQVNSAALASALPRGVTAFATGAPTLDPSTFSGSSAYEPEVATVPVQFNSRGLPCVGTASACSNWDTSGKGQQVGFLIYFKMDKTMGGTGWGAITIMPAGRINTWFYDGASYEKM